MNAPAAVGVLTKTAGGTRTDRPVLEQLLDRLRPGDTLAVWKLDRLGRSLRHLVDIITWLAACGIRFRSLQEAIDTTPAGKLFFHVFAALAEFEGDLIREQTSAGLATTRARVARQPMALATMVHAYCPHADCWWNSMVTPQQ